MSTVFSCDPGNFSYVTPTGSTDPVPVCTSWIETGVDPALLSFSAGIQSLVDFSLVSVSQYVAIFLVFFITGYGAGLVARTMRRA